MDSSSMFETPKREGFAPPKPLCRGVFAAKWGIATEPTVRDSQRMNMDQK